MTISEYSYLAGMNRKEKNVIPFSSAIAKLIKEKALAYTMVEVSEKIIDKINILEATKLGMKQAIEELAEKFGNEGGMVVLTDGNMTLDVALPQQSVVHGDALSYSIGAASIIAKVHRDKMMEDYDLEYPMYGFKKNKGYGTAEHIQGIKEHGLCPIHRRTFTKKF